jgi:DNA polymerase-3 subunit epsilon
VIKKAYIDVETTGTNFKECGIHQISGIIEQDNQVAESFDFHVRPKPGAAISPRALEIAGKTEEEIMAYPEMSVVFKQLTELLKSYVNPYAKQDKLHFLGYNCRTFDEPFIREFFKDCGSSYYGSFFWSGSIDVYVLAAEALVHKRHIMPNFKLHTVASSLGIKVDKDRLHDAAYDVELTREIYMIITNRDLL